MAVDLFSEASPRYSFSSDINLPTLAPTRSDLNPLDSTGIDFEFGISDQESSSADELFSQGILLPIQIREKGALTNKQPINPQQEAPITQVKDDAIVKEAELSTFLEAEEKDQSKAASFWSFKRSSSLNHDAAQGNKKGLLCSLQEGLSRSNSTGSVPNPKKLMQQNKDKVLNSSKQHPPPLPKSSSTSSSSSSTSSSYYQYHQKPKNYYGGNTNSPGGGGSRTNSVLNVPPPYISNTNLFGLGSLFRNGKEKKPKK